jgi:TolB-like protein/class 3 adenylate cyclase/Flp pilus assembly protein TadD
VHSPADPESDLTLEIAHVLLIDVVGYSKLLVNGQIEVLKALNRAVRNTPQFRAAEASGKLMRLPTGDGMALLFFDSAETPVLCALEISAAAKGDPRLQLRMGAHSGPIKQVTDVNDRANFAGAGINLAQRVLDCGDAGHILLSKRIAEDLSSYRQWHPYLHDLGECEVKHGVKMHLFNLCKDGLGNPELPDKVRQQRRRLRRLQVSTQQWMARSPLRKAVVVGALVLLLAGLGLLVWSIGGTPQGRSIAVLPFGGDANTNASFLRGIHEEIVSDLMKVGELKKVISRNSVLFYGSGAPRDPNAIARTLGVTHLLEGNVQQDGDRILVHAQLTDGETNAQIWRGRFSGDLGDLFGIQNDIAEQIVRELRLRLSPAERASIEEAPTNDNRAYALYLEAKGLIESAVYGALGEQELRQAVGKLTQAVERDAAFHAAFYQLAHAHDQLYLRFDRAPERLAAAESAIKTLAQLRPNSAETHLAQAKHLYWAYRDYVRAREELALARQLSPKDPTPSLLLAYIDRREGRWERSTQNLKRALELDPRNANMLQQLSLTYFNQRRFGDMRRALARAVDFAADDPVTRAQLASVELECCADPIPLRRVIEDIRRIDPSALPKIADQWIDLTITTGDYGFATDALKHLGDHGCQVEAIPFPRRWCEGMVARAQGNEAAARNAFEEVRAEMEKTVREQPGYAGAFCVLGMANAALGRKDEAIQAGVHAVELLPISKDALNGPLLLGYLSVIYAWSGEIDRALKHADEATSVPSFWSYGKLRLHPYWDPLRSDPRFEKIVASLAPKGQGRD